MKKYYSNELGNKAVLRIEVAPVPTISNNMNAIPCVILIVNLFLFIFDIDFLP